MRVSHSKQSQQASEEAARQVAIHKRALVTAANEKETLAERLAQKDRQLRTLQKEREGVREAEGDDDRDARWLKQIQEERVAAVKVRFLRDWVFVRPFSSVDHPNTSSSFRTSWYRHTSCTIGTIHLAAWAGLL
eukprot:COSAG06_NODE_19091_length_854_cov_0.785430_2_plen_133_part_01